MRTDERVNRALAGELPSEELTLEETQRFDAEAARRLHDRLRTVDMSLSENQSVEPVSDVAATPSGEVTLTRLDGDVRSVSLDDVAAAVAHIATHDRALLDRLAQRPGEATTLEEMAANGEVTPPQRVRRAGEEPLGFPRVSIRSGRSIEEILDER